MILLTDKEIEDIILKVCQGYGYAPTQRGYAEAMAKAQLKKLLREIRKDSHPYILHSCIKGESEEGIVIHPKLWQALLKEVNDGLAPDGH